MNNILTIDVEDWYQGLDLPTSSWPQFAKRPSLGLDVRLQAGSAQTLWELPISTFRSAGVNWPVGGGFYARFWPYTLLANAIRRLNKLGQPAVFYFHPWEFDPAQPVGAAGTRWLAHAT